MNERTIDRLHALRAEHPNITYSEAARALGVSRQSLHEMCGRAGVNLASGKGVGLTAAERAVEADLLARGMAVYRQSKPTPGAPDIVAATDPLSLVAIWVVAKRPDEAPFGRVFAWVTRSGRVHYMPPMP